MMSSHGSLTPAQLELPACKTYIQKTTKGENKGEEHDSAVGQTRQKMTQGDLMTPKHSISNQDTF